MSEFPAASPEGSRADTTESPDALTRYPGWNVLAKWTSPDWDEQTRAVVQRRLAAVPPIRFLSSDEAKTLAAVAERIIPQPHRGDHQKVPIVPWIDEKLLHDHRDGYRYAELPPVRDVWRLGIEGIDESARSLHGQPFAELNAAAQDAVLARIQSGDPPGATWHRLPASRFFRDVLCATIVRFYYAHPAAWSEIGYSGPSSQRGRVRNWIGGVDAWDAPDEEGG